MKTNTKHEDAKVASKRTETPPPPPPKAAKQAEASREAPLHPKERPTKNRSAFVTAKSAPGSGKAKAPVRERPTKNRSSFAQGGRHAEDTRPQPAKLNEASALKDIQAATRKSPAEGAKVLLRHLNDTADSHQRESLLKSASPEVGQIAHAILPGGSEKDSKKRREAVAALQECAELGGTKGAQTLAHAFAAKMPESQLAGRFVRSPDYSELAGNIKDGVTEGNGARFGVALGQALRAGGKSEDSDLVLHATHDGIDSVRKDVEEASTKINTDEQHLADMVKSFGPAMDKRSVARAVNAFRKRHEDDYKEFEEVGDKAARALAGAGSALDDKSLPSDLHDASEKLLENLPMMSFTHGGQEALRGALIDQAHGQKTFLGHAQEAMSKTDDPEQSKQMLDDALLKTMTSQAINYRQAGEPAESDNLLKKGLMDNAQLLGFALDSAASVGDALQAVANKNPGADAQLHSALEKAGHHAGALRAAAASKLAGHVLEDLHGVGIALRVAANIRDLSNFDKMDMNGKILTATSTVDATTASAGFALDALGKAEQFAKLSKFLGRTNLLTNAVYAAYDTRDALKAFHEGDVAKAAAIGTGAVGEGILAGSGIYAIAFGAEALPGPGTVIGAALLAGGIAGHYIVDWVHKRHEERATEADNRAFLKAGGYDDNMVARLSDAKGSSLDNLGPFVNALAAHVGVTPKQMVQYVDSLSDDQWNQFKDVGWNVKPDDEGKLPQHADSDKLVFDNVESRPMGAGRGVIMEPVKPESIPAAAYWLKHHGLLPKGAAAGKGR
jgi:hypothetical protein